MSFVGSFIVSIVIKSLIFQMGRSLSDKMRCQRPVHSRAKRQNICIRRVGRLFILIIKKKLQLEWISLVLKDIYSKFHFIINLLVLMAFKLGSHLFSG